jgi:hypothetical protein
MNQGKSFLDTVISTRTYEKSNEVNMQTRTRLGS